MEIGLIYSKADPRQAEARNFVERFIEERGILASIIESEQPVLSPTIIINGRTLKEKRSTPRGREGYMYPNLSDIGRALEEQLWGM